VKARARNPIAVLLAFISILLSASATLAEDYSVDFGADTDRGRDAGTLHCQFGKSCEGKMDSLGLGVGLLISHRDDTAQVRLNGADVGCCYFAYAKDSIVIDARTPLSWVPIFKGMRSKGGLFIENERAGTLYLKFHFSGNSPDNPRRLEKSTWRLSKENLYRRRIPPPSL
jgi:hypothetical protein